MPGKAIEHAECRLQELVKAGERDVRLELDAAGAEHPHRAGLLHGIPEQGRLPDPGLTAQQQGRAGPYPSVRQDSVYAEPLSVAAEQHRAILLPVGSMSRVVRIQGPLMRPAWHDRENRVGP